MQSDNKILSNIQEVILKYRIHSQSITNSKRGKVFLFCEKAKEFYRQRKKYGKDTYDSFNPEEIMNINTKTTTNKLFLKSEIESSFRLNEFSKAKKQCEKYMKHHGIFNNVPIYYILAHTNRAFIDIIRKILF